MIFLNNHIIFYFHRRIRKLVRSFHQQIRHIKYGDKNYLPSSPPTYKKKTKPVNAWAFIRVKDEMRTLPACLNSITPTINKGVIAYNPSNNLEEERFILDFCKQHNGFIPFKYNHDIIPANSREYLSSTDKNRHLDTYYNAAFNLIPDGEWFIKIDADHIYDTKRLLQLLSLPTKDNQVISIARLNLDIADGQLRLIHFPQQPYVDPCDHWLMRKVPELKFTLDIAKEDAKHFHAYEKLSLDTTADKYQWDIIRTDLITWHFPYLKHARNHLKRKTIPIENHSDVLEPGLRIPAEMLDIQYIKNVFKEVGFKELS